MANTLIRERAAERLRGIDVPAAIKASKAFWASPEGRRAEVAYERRKLRAIERNRGFVKFPALAKRKGTRPAIGGIDEVKDAAARFGLRTH